MSTIQNPDNETPKAILGLLEDDPDQALLYIAWFKSSGYAVLWCKSAEEFREANAQHQVDALVMDWGLPGESGMEMLYRLRRKEQLSLPVLFITARDDEASIVAALDQGADDFVTKPARKRELVARVEAMLRRANVQSGRESTVIGHVTIEFDKRRVLVDGDVVDMTEREFDVLSFLANRLGSVVNRKTLYEAVWRQPLDESSRTVDTHISRVRQKLGLTGDSGLVLSSVYQLGYRLEML